VGVFVAKLACELPRERALGLSSWDCVEIARRLVADRVVDSISAETVRRMLADHRLKPWRVHHWMSAKVPRDAVFASTTRRICDLYVGPLPDDEEVWSIDEMTSLQPRPRIAPTRPARPKEPILVEHEYRRAGALQLFGAKNVRTGKVFGICYPRKRQAEFIHFLEALDAHVPASIRKIHVVLDNVSYHHGKQVQAWLSSHPRFQFTFTPVHCSWMNQIEQWFSVLKRKSLRYSDFASDQELGEHIYDFIDHHNLTAQPPRWSSASFAKVLAKCDERMAA
jgi:transposase